jgi:MoxR-like ATPase
VAERFASVESVARQLLGAGYLADGAIADAVFLADRLDKPVLVEGPAGVGKTSLATAVAAVTGARLLRLQCYEGLDEAKALYEWNYRKQLLRIQATGDQSWDRAQADIFGEEFLLQRPLLAAIRADEPVVLLIDEVDRVEAETEALLLEVLSEFQVSIPELGTMTARQRPLVFLTSNGTRELSEALKRRCLFLHVSYPEPDREEEIIRLHVPDLGAGLGAQVARLVHRIRELDLRKRPSISETIDWARTLRVLGVGDLREAALNRTISVLLKHQADIDLARDKLGLLAATGEGGAA